MFDEKKATVIDTAAKDFSWEYHYSDQKLGDVLSMSEVELLWHKKRETIMYKWATGKLSGRKTITGGTILFTARSIFALWGEPKRDLVAELKKEKE